MHPINGQVARSLTLSHISLRKNGGNNVSKVAFIVQTQNRFKNMKYLFEGLDKNLFIKYFFDFRLDLDQTRS